MHKVRNSSDPFLIDTSFFKLFQDAPAYTILQSVVPIQEQQNQTEDHHHNIMAKRHILKYIINLYSFNHISLYV